MNGGYYKEDNIPCQIEEGLFLGSFGAANDEEELNRLNITHILTVGAMTALLRNLDHCISSYSFVIRKSEIEDAEECFKLFSLEEAAKFDEVTLANVNNFKKRSKNQSPNAIHKEYIVKLPTISGTHDLKKALHKLGAISLNKIMMISSKEASCLS
ncbi:uncharacterized protein LOC112183605 [Rosa chinensis]|uniref:uncharacterized protein LOC112183605 n=1 Tax=Rosa chinensis TaxID=74649 RepID=UPI001AD900CD|nr:uncharacterized protein LOC112183605 [Rosa chinensis]